MIEMNRNIEKINSSDTIAAVATAVGGGIGIVRISGSEALAILDRLFVPNRQKKKTWETHRIYYGTICEEENTIDEVLVSVMKGPHSYTREDVVEINCHGGVHSVQGILRSVLKNGARLAEAGEFTKRAFLNGRIDLSQAEAVIDMIQAKTELSQKTALSQLQGRLSEKVRRNCHDLLHMIAQIEAAIDYPEHEEIDMAMVEIHKGAKGIIGGIDELLKNSQSGRFIREGIATVILGKPNVGKSSLLNVLLQENRAIVTDVAGTTRDVLVEQISLGGIPLKLIDTAGIRETSDAVEKIGVERSREYAEHADLILLVLDMSNPLSEEDKAVLTEVKEKNKKTIVLLNKSDLAPAYEKEDLSPWVESEDCMLISALEEKGIEELTEKIKELFFSGEVVLENTELVTNMRHISALERGKSAMEAAINTIENGLPEDFVSIDLQQAYHALCEITGDNIEEDLIDTIFSKFCLGK